MDFMTFINWIRIIIWFNWHRVTTDVTPNSPKLLAKVFWIQKGMIVTQANLGNTIESTQMQLKPNVTWVNEPGSYYTLMMVDPDVYSRKNATQREFIHYMVVNIPSDRVWEGEIKIEYIGSTAKEDTGLHRFTQLVYKQTSRGFFDEKFISERRYWGRPGFHADKFAQKYGMTLIAGNFVRAGWDESVPLLTAKFIY